MSDETRQLIETAERARQRAFAKYSGFQVGAALLTQSGKIFLGCNVENASFGLTICAERVAATTAIAAGEPLWQRMVLVTKGAVTPCGACRQFLCEFCPDLQIDLVEAGHDQIHRSFLLRDLLPSRFDEF